MTKPALLVGVLFDGMMSHTCKFPLGRIQSATEKPFKTELIKPVDKMLKYLSSEESLKNGYHLNEILTDTCFVDGDQIVYDEFLEFVQKFKSSKTQKEKLEDIRK